MLSDHSKRSEGDPVARLEGFFTRIWHTRMLGLPVLNPALRVEAVGFQPWEGGWLGVLITPWFMNLLWIPGEGETLSGRTGDKVVRPLPAGQCEFTVCREEEFGDYSFCSLFSPMAGFSDQDSARTTAMAILEALLEAAKPSGDGVEETNVGPARRLSRRDLLRGAFSGKC